jgi:hypothetical protein
MKRSKLFATLLAVAIVPIGSGCTMGPADNDKTTLTDLSGEAHEVTLGTVSDADHVETRVDVEGTPYVVRANRSAASWSLHVEGGGLVVELGPDLHGTWARGKEHAEFNFTNRARLADIVELRRAVVQGGAVPSDVARERVLLPAAFAAVESWPHDERTAAISQALRRWAGRMIAPTSGGLHPTQLPIIELETESGSGGCALSCESKNDGGSCNVSCSGPGYWPWSPSSCAQCSASDKGVSGTYCMCVAK